MIKLLLPLILSVNLFALSPFSLEGIKSVNIKVIDKSKLINEKDLDILKLSLESELKKLKMRTSSDLFSNFIVKIQAIKLKEKIAFHTSMFIVEESAPIRDKSQENMSITYYKDDFFDTTHKDLHVDVKESILDYLLSDFIDQYKEEN